MPTKPTNELLTAAIEGFEEEKRRLDSRINEIRAILSGTPAKAGATPEAPTGRRKKFSAASRRKMALAQKARWAKIKGESEPSTPATSESANPKRRKMSAAGKRAIAEAQRKRWAESKKQSGLSEAPKPKRKLSAAGRQAIIAATKRRWALKRAEPAEAS
jgi:hypothetical protein